MEPFVVLERKKLFEQVAAHLEREIMTGKLQPGQSLPPERDLRVKFGVGRPAIREALITLEKAGLIEIASGAPARVAAPDVHRVIASMMPAVQRFLANVQGQQQLQGARLFMEVGLVRNAAMNATEDDLARLEKALEENHLALGNREEFIRTDVRFHYVLAEVMRNPAFLALHDAMSTWLREQRRVALLEPYEDRAAYEAHARIYNAVAARDPDAAEAAMRQHMEWGWVSYWRRYGNDNSDAVT